MLFLFYSQLFFNCCNTTFVFFSFPMIEQPHVRLLILQRFLLRVSPSPCLCQLKLRDEVPSPVDQGTATSGKCSVLVLHVCSCNLTRAHKCIYICIQPDIYIYFWSIYVLRRLGEREEKASEHHGNRQRIT